MNDVFTFTGTATAHYDDSSVKDVTDDVVIETAPDMSTTGNKTAVLSYTEGGVKVTADFDITVKDAKPAGSKSVTYCTYGFASLVYIDLENSVLPPYVEGSGTLTITVVPEQGYAVITVLYKEEAELTSLGSNQWSMSVAGLADPIEINIMLGYAS